MNLRRWKKTVYFLLAAIVAIPTLLIAAFDTCGWVLSISFGVSIALLVAILIGALKLGRCPYCSYLLGKDFYLYGMAHCPRCGRRI